MTTKVTMRKFLIGAILVAPFSIATASYVDFTSTDWDEGSVPYETSIMNSIDGISVTAVAGPTGASLYHDTTDGLGVRYSYETDEIEESEVLTISFASTVLLNSIGISDLFIESRGGHTYTEYGYYSTDGGTPVQFYAIQETGTNGELLISGLNLMLDSISFTAIGKQTLGEDHEFSLKSLTFSAVPIPSAFWLFGTALIGFISLSRRTSL